MQDQARLLFNGAFAYYRNYAAHDGANIDEKSSIRILMLASELLDLVDASQRSFERIGGIQGLIKGVFRNERELGSLLRFLNGRTVIEHDFGAHLEHLYEKGFDEIQQEAVFDLGLVKYEETEAVTDRLNEFTLVGYIELTDQGYKVLDELDDS